MPVAGWIMCSNSPMFSTRPFMGMSNPPAMENVTARLREWGNKGEPHAGDRCNH